MHKIFAMPFATVYPLYINKIQRKAKGHTTAQLDQAITWLTGYTTDEIAAHVARQTTFTDFFAGAQINPNAGLITGTICGVKVQDIDDPLMQQIRYLDKLVDEIANGRPMEKILRTPKTE